MPRTIPPGYESKYAEFIRLCTKAKADNVGHAIVAEPWVLGGLFMTRSSKACRVWQKPAWHSTLVSGDLRPPLERAEFMPDRRDCW